MRDRPRTRNNGAADGDLLLVPVRLVRQILLVERRTVRVPQARELLEPQTWAYGETLNNLGDLFRETGRPRLAEESYLDHVCDNA